MRKITVSYTRSQLLILVLCVAGIGTGISMTFHTWFPVITVLFIELVMILINIKTLYLFLFTDKEVKNGQVIDE